MGGKQIKVYTYWNKKDKPEIRRLEVESLYYVFELHKHLQEVYPALKNIEYTIFWKDEEGDDIIISTDKELQVAIKQMPDIVRLHVQCKEVEKMKVDAEVGKAAGVDAANAVPPCMVNYGVVCDGCEANVVGVRYKCTVCDDYDLCAKCEGAGLHPDHFMLRIPIGGLPRTVIRAAIKRSRHILKNVATKSEEHCKRSRADKSSERKRNQHASGDGHQGKERRECPRKRINWIDTVAMYMNEFANLAGDIQIDISKVADPQSTRGQNTPSAKNTESTDAQKNNSAASETPEATATKQSEAEARQAKIEKYAKFMREYLAATQAQNVPQPSTSSANANNEEIGQGDRKTAEDKEDSISDKESVTSDVSSQTIESKKDDTPDRVDDWTVINKEKDLLDACMKPSAPQEPAAPIGFNLPEEFQQRVTISQGQSLYPPLNVATAVLDPKEAEPAPGKPAASAAKAPEPAKAPEAAKPQDSAAKKPIAKPQQPYHPMAHINAALEHMLNMGFTNDGGWLTQLLESKDGNIAAVLDLLTPVNPKK